MIGFIIIAITVSAFLVFGISTYKLCVCLEEKDKKAVEVFKDGKCVFSLTPTSIPDKENWLELKAWRSPGVVIHGLGKAAFDHYLEEYALVFNDNDPLAEDRRFWEERLVNAVTHKTAHVYVLCGDDLIPILYREEYANLWYSNYPHVYVISKSELK